MNLNDYQDKAKLTAVDMPTVLEINGRVDKTGFKHRRNGDWVYVTLGLGSEVGELQGILKKVLRDNGGQINSETQDKLKAELGDILWYVAMVAYRLGFYLDDVAECNLRKLADRQQRGVLGGSGDER